MLRRLAVPFLAIALMVTGVALVADAVSADPRDFTLVNNSDSTIYHVFVQPSGPGEDWGPDILGQDVLLPGESVLVYFQGFTEGNCFYDIRVETEDGEWAELTEVDLCSTFEVIYG